MSAPPPPTPYRVALYLADERVTDWQPAATIADARVTLDRETLFDRLVVVDADGRVVADTSGWPFGPRRVRPGDFVCVTRDREDEV